MRRESLPAFCEKGEIWREKVFSLEERRRLDAGWGVASSEKKFMWESLEAHYFSIYCFFSRQTGLSFSEIFHTSITGTAPNIPEIIGRKFP